MKLMRANRYYLNAQPSEPNIYCCLDHAQSWNPSDHRGWDARSLPGDLKTRYAHLARFARYAHYVRDIPGTQDEPLGFASLASAARVMDDILTPIPIDLRDLG